MLDRISTSSHPFQREKYSLMNSEQNRRSAPAAAKTASSRLVMAHTARFVHGPGRAGEARQEELSALCTPSADRFIMTHRLLCTIPLEKASPFLRTLPAKFFFHAKAFSTIYNLFSVSVSPAGFFQNIFGDFNNFRFLLRNISSSDSSQSLAIQTALC